MLPNPQYSLLDEIIYLLNAIIGVITLLLKRVYMSRIIAWQIRAHDFTVWYIYTLIMFRNGLSFLLFFCGFYNAAAQDNTPKYANEFLNLGVGARSFGMANTQVGIVKDATAGYWNPAGLTQIKEKYQFSLMHAELFSGISKYDYLGFGMQLDSTSALGVTLIRFGIDDIPDTRFLYDANGALNYSNIRFFSAADYALLISYARKMSFLEGLSMAANFKILYRSVGSFANAWGFGLDFGAMYQNKGWSIGLMLRDITGTFTAWNHNTDEVQVIYTQTNNQIPETSLEVALPRIILGGGKRFVLKKNWGFLPSLDMIMTFDGNRNTLISSNTVSIEGVFGLETDYKQIVFLRAGVGNVQDIKNFDGSTTKTAQPSFGLGVRINQLNIDYALTDMANGSDALYSHIISINVRLDK